jgi:hypothetical protein
MDHTLKYFLQKRKNLSHVLHRTKQKKKKKSSAAVGEKKKKRRMELSRSSKSRDIKKRAKTKENSRIFIPLF